MSSLPISFLLRRIHRSQRGMSMIELLVTIAIIAVMGMIALPALNRSVVDLSAAKQELISRLRLARANATSRGAHFRVTLSSSSYAIQRLADDDGDGLWTPTGASETVHLPSTVSLAVTDGDGVIEFDSRGLIEPPDADTPPEVERMTLSDAHKKTALLEVYPSGQVLEM
ncbi:MAG: GspH/FimT family pseudopilin [Candidatus Binatia bacterium]